MNQMTKVCLGVFTISCSASVPPSGELVDIGVATQALTCPDATTGACSLGRWPDGIVYYTYAQGPMESVADFEQRKQDIAAAMKRWEAAAGSTITFTPNDARSDKVTFLPCNAFGGEASGYDVCKNGCIASLCGSITDHELGHLLGLKHEFQRFDRDHYLRDNISCNPLVNLGDYERCSRADNDSDFGPFDYHSSLMYDAHHPDLTRWDGSPVCPNLAADNACQYTVQSGPKGWPTKVDGAAVTELYRLDSGWAKFQRTQSVEHGPAYDPTTQVPFDEVMTIGVTIDEHASPAVETWGNASLALYVRATDDNVWKSFRSPGTPSWSAWENLGAPAGSGTTSDPAVASWADGRSDLVVRKGDAIYITSTPSWGAWESLGAPAAGAASAPAIAAPAIDRLHVFVRGTDDHLYYKRCVADCDAGAGRWSAWAAIGDAAFKGKPAVVARDSDVFDVFLHGTDDRLWNLHFENGGWGNFDLVDEKARLQWDAACPDCSSPAAGARADASLDVYIRGTDDKLWVSSKRESWSGFKALGGVLSSSPATVTRARDDGEADVVVIMPEERENGRYHYATWWKHHPR